MKYPYTSIALAAWTALALIAFSPPGPVQSQEPSIVVHATPAIAAPAALGTVDLSGPDTAKSGTTITICLTGTPALELSKPLTDQLQWLMGSDAMTAHVLMPGQPAVPLDVEGTIVFAAGGATMRPQVHFPAGQPGEYRVVVDWNYQANQFVEHVVVVDGDSPNPPLPPVPPDPPDPVDPPAPPDPPAPNPAAKWQVMFFLESTDVDDLPAGQIELLSSLTFRQSLDAAGHRFMGRYDRDSVMETRSVCNGVTCRPYLAVKSDLAPWWGAVKGDPLPRIAIAPIDGGDIRDFPMPADESALYKLLEAQQ